MIYKLRANSRLLSRMFGFWHREESTMYTILTGIISDMAYVSISDDDDQVNTSI